MAENQALLAQLQRKNVSIQRLLTPSLKQSADTQPFAGRKFQVAARKMRVLTADGPSLTNRGQISSLSSEVVHRFQNAETGLHINPKMLQAKNKTWDGVERVFHGSGTVQAKRESTPAMPGEMRQGSIIPRMETFPKPGQPIEAFRQQVESTPRPSRTPEPAKKAVIAPKSRLFTKVEEISRQPAKNAPAPADEPDLPALSLRSPPSAAPDAPVQRKVEQVEPPSAAPVIQRAVDLPDPVSFEAGKSSDVSATSDDSALPNLPVTVARKAETVLPPISSPLALPAKQVARLPLSDQPKPPAAKAVQRKEDDTGKTPAALPVAATPSSISLPAQAIQRAAIENEPETLGAAEMPGNLSAENKEPMSDETLVQAKLLQPKPFTPASVLPVVSRSPLSETRTDAPKAPMVQAKPVQRQLARPLQAKLVQTKSVDAVKPVLTTPQSGTVSTTATPVQGSSPSATGPVALVQRASFKDADSAEDATSALNEPPVEDAFENATVARKEIASQVQRAVSAPESPVEEETPLLQAKLVQRESVEPEDEEVLRKPMLAQAKSVQLKPAPTPLVQAKSVSLPLATQNRILPTSQNSVQRVEHTDSPLSPAMPSMGFPAIARLVEKPEGFSSGNSLIRRMPLVEKIHSRPRMESLLRSVDSEPSATKISQPALVQRQPSALIQAEKYQSMAMPAVLPDMALPRSSVAPISSPAMPTVSSPMTLARKAETGVVTPAQFAAPVQQTGGVGSENAFSGLVQRTVTEGVSQDQPSVAAEAGTEQAQPGEAGKEKAKPVDLNALAEDIFPIVKRMLAIEADRSGGGFR